MEFDFADDPSWFSCSKVIENQEWEYQSKKNSIKDFFFNLFNNRLLKIRYKFTLGMFIFIFYLIYFS